MSQIALSPPAGGTGVFTIAAPATNTNRTLTLPDETGTVLSTATPGVPVNGPAFSAFQSTAQTVSASTFTKVTLQSEEFDTGNAFDSTTNFRFLPLVAGYYFVNGMVAVGVSTTGIICSIFKNGSEFKRGQQTSSTSDAGVSALVFFNGSSDYVEMFTLIGVSQTLAANSVQTYFQAYLSRSAL